MRVQCPECGVEFTASPLLTHHHIHNGVNWGDQGGAPPPPSKVGPDLLGLLPKTAGASPVPGRGVTGWGVKLI